MTTRISATGNLAATPELNRDKSDGEPYSYLPVVVSDRVQDKDGTWKSGPRERYQVVVRGELAVRIVELAEASGNIAIHFEGRLVKKEQQSGGRAYEKRIVYTDWDGVTIDLVRQRVTVQSPRGPQPAGPTGDEITGPARDSWERYADQRRDD